MIKLICAGKIKEKYLKDGIEDYLKRINKYHRMEIIEIEDATPEIEEVKILKYIDNKDYVITLEIEGDMLNSVQLADKIDKTFITNSNITFVIGGSYGLSDNIKKKANYRLSFSKMTFPHGLFRLIFLEQIYRSFKILNNETYHK